MTILLITHKWDISPQNWKGTRLLKTNLSMISAVEIKGESGNERLRPTKYEPFPLLKNRLLFSLLG